MKRTILFLTAVLAMGFVQAQTFTVTNADGVVIKYIIRSDSMGEHAAVERNNYTGRVVIPDTVEYEGVAYEVRGLWERAFNNSTVTYVHLPATVWYMASRAFANCNQLDTIQMDSELPVALPNALVSNAFGDTYNRYDQVVVKVPCGTLGMWHKSPWSPFKNLVSDCAYRLTVLPTQDSIVKVDGIELADGRINYSNGYYEAGDTALLTAAVFSWKNASNVTQAKRGYFLGWGDGSVERQRPYVMPQHDDTVYCIAETMPYGTLHANRISTPVYIFGTLSYDGETAGYQLDMGDYQASTIFAASVWMGNRDHMAAGRFMNDGHDFFPGPLRTTDAKSTVEFARMYNRVWHLTREMIDYHIAHCGETDYVPVDDILTWPANGDVSAGFAAQLAPYYDADNSGCYNPYAGDYPLIRGDECIFSIFNDGYTTHTESHGNALGVEIHCMTYAFNEPADSALWNSVFVHYDIYNRSQNSYDSTFLGAWTDFDIGYAWDDYIGCDVQNNMFYGYNGKMTDGPGDGAFHGTPPAQGTLILSHDGEQGMTSFMAYDNSTSSYTGEPMKASDYYYYMRGLMKNGDYPWYGPMGGYQYMYPGVSDTVNFVKMYEFTNGNAPGDRRGVGGSGPFTFESGACRHFDVAHLTAWSNESDSVGCFIATLAGQAPELRRQWLRDTTDSGRPFVYRPYSAPHEAGIDGVQQASLQVYPNPTSGMLTAVVPTAGEVQLFDMMGRRVLVQQVAGGKVTLDLGGLPQGIYLLRAAGAVQRVVRK